MAKKKFNISSTLKKNKKEEVELAPKVPLKKTSKNMEDVKEKVEAIHADEPPKTKTKTTTPSTKSRNTTKSKAEIQPAEEQKQKMVRMTIDTPEEMHLQLKIKSIQARMSMRDYVLGLIEKDLKK